MAKTSSLDRNPYEGKRRPKAFGDFRLMMTRFPYGFVPFRVTTTECCVNSMIALAFSWLSEGSVIDMIYLIPSLYVAYASFRSHAVQQSYNIEWILNGMLVILSLSPCSIKGPIVSWINGYCQQCRNVVHFYCAWSVP